MADREDLRTASSLVSVTSRDRIRRAREYHGWTQTELAREMDPPVSAAALSQLESGRTKPSAATLVSLAEATGFPLKYFVRRSGDAATAGYFRSLTSTPAKERKRALARANLLRDLAVALDRYVEIPEPDVPRIEPETNELLEMEEIADHVRRVWKLGWGPIKNVVRLLERHGVIVARLPIETRKVDAFSVSYADWPIVILGSDKMVTARSRFDAAHELGHLIMHSGEDAGTRLVEQQAHTFAAALLMPRRGIRDALVEADDWSDFLDLKQEWGVSLAALVKRANTLGIMNNNDYMNAMKSMSARGWRRVEPGDDLLGRPEAPRLLVEAVRVADLELDELADQAGLPLSAIEELLQETDQRRRLDL